MGRDLTHADVIRYFMTIPEAAQLVIQAGALAKRGDIFILDMGKPVKIGPCQKNDYPICKKPVLSWKARLVQVRL